MANHFNRGKCFLPVLLLFLVTSHAYTQNYYAIQGSNYAGSLGIGNNPATIVNNPYQWDLALFAVQAKHTTNGVTINKYSLLSSPAKSEYQFRAGDYRRYLYADQNINLLNGRFALNRRKAIGFGINLRSYTHLKTSAYNFNDTIQTARHFFELGNTNRNLQADLMHNTWVEAFATYAQTIYDVSDARLNVGITAKISRGLSAAHTKLYGGTVSIRDQGTTEQYVVENAALEYGYSSNYDGWQKEKGSRQNIRDFVTKTQAGISFDFGLEYLIKPGNITAVFDEDDYYDYNWKIGISVLDFGFNRYKYGRESRIVNGVMENVSDTVLDQRFSSLESMKDFNEKLVGVARDIQQPTGQFTVLNPTRLVVNVDRYISGAWYVNGNASLNVASRMGQKFHLSELNRITITPLWETSRLGFYMPVHFNTKNRVWVGSAVKWGPLLLGIHNWGNVFAKNKMQNGGAYLSIIIRPGKKTTERLDKRLDCPTASR